MRFAEVVGGVVRKVREEAGIRQEDLAQAAQSIGLEWQRSTIAQLELGQRELSAQELLLLPIVLRRATTLTVELSELVAGVESGYVQMTAATSVPASTLVWIVSDEAEQVDPKNLHVSLGALPIDEAERKAARRVGHTIGELQDMAQRRWGRSIVEERESRLAERTTPAMTARSIQARRGLITRELLIELTAEAEEG